MARDNFYKRGFTGFITYGDSNLGEAIADKMVLLYKDKLVDSDNLNICEIGFGRGLVTKGFLDRLRTKNPSLYEKTNLLMVDIASKHCSEIKRILPEDKSKLNFVCADALHLPFRNGTLDFQYSNELMDILGFDLYEKGDGILHKVVYSKSDDAFLLSENINGEWITKAARHIVPRTVKVVEEIGFKGTRALIPKGVSLFLGELERTLKDSSYALHLDYFCRDPSNVVLRAYLPNSEVRKRIDIMNKDGFHSFTVSGEHANRFDVTFDIPYSFVKDTLSDSSLEIEQFVSQGLFFSGTEKGDEKCVFVGELQKYLSIYSYINMLRVMSRARERVFDLDQIRDIVKDYSFFVPLRMFEGNVEDSMFGTLSDISVPYWVGISLERMLTSLKQRKFIKAGIIPKSLLSRNYNALLLKKNKTRHN